MALALNNLKRVDMPLNKETKPNQTNVNNIFLILLKCQNIFKSLKIFLKESQTCDLKRQEKKKA